MWLSRRYMLLRLLVNMYVYVVCVFVCSTTRNSALSSTRRTFGSHGKHAMMLICNGPLNTP